MTAKRISKNRMLYFAYYEDEDGIQDYTFCNANNEKDAIRKFIEKRFPGITICHPECLKAKTVNRPAESISNAVELSGYERDYLADKTFWDWKRAEIDVMFVKDPRIGSDKAREYWVEQEKFYHELYDKLKGEEDSERDRD